MIGHKWGSVHPCCLLDWEGFSISSSLSSSSFMPATLALLMFWRSTTVFGPSLLYHLFFLLLAANTQHGDSWPNLSHHTRSCVYLAPPHWHVLQGYCFRSCVKSLDPQAMLITVNLFPGLYNPYRLNLTNDCLCKPQDNLGIKNVTFGFVPFELLVMNYRSDWE